MKKILLLSALMTIFTTGCVSPTKTFNADTPINGESLTINFAANDEDKIEIKTSFPKSDTHVLADKETYDFFLDQYGNSCVCLIGNICHIGHKVCKKYTGIQYVNVTCITESSFQNNFDNTEQKFYARTFSPHYSTDNRFDPVPVCYRNVSKETNEFYKANFERSKNGSILTYKIIPTKKSIESNWQSFYLFQDDKMPTNEQELAKTNNLYNYALHNPVDIKSIFNNAVSVEYKSGIDDFITKYDPVSRINTIKKKSKGKYSVNINDERHDCHYITLSKDESLYSYSVDIKLCRIQNTQSEASIGSAKITIKNAGTVDLTHFGNVIKEISGYLK